MNITHKLSLLHVTSIFMLDFNSSIQLQKLCDAVLFVIEAL